MMGFRGRDLRRLPWVVLSAFRVSEDNPREVVKEIVTMAERARREGLLSLQERIKQIRNPLLARGLQLIVDGTDPEVVRETLETQVHVGERSRMTAMSALEAAGGYAPTIGIIGTVMGLVQVLQHLSEAEKLGHAIALAFLATFYGIASANLIWLPLASKVKQNILHETLLDRMYITGVVGLQTGEAPRVLKEKLEVYLNESYRGEGAEGDE
jgi:chemotaxis protein MotA